MHSSLKSRSKTPLQFKIFHTLLGLAVFFSLITVPAESQTLMLWGMPMASELLWWPWVFFIFQLIYRVYGFAYLRHAVYLVILFHAIYLLFLKFAIWLPSSSFWNMQETYSSVLGRDFFYLLKSSLFLWACVLLPLKTPSVKKSRYLFLMGLIIFSFLDLFLLNANADTAWFQIIFVVWMYGVTTLFSDRWVAIVSRVEHTTFCTRQDMRLLRFRLPDIQNAQRQTFKYHHILFCSSIVFFIASKTMAAKFISLGFLTINVGGIVFSLAYLVADMMTDVYGVERTKQMILFVIFSNLLFVFDVWITNCLAINENGAFKAILHNQARMFIASGIAFFLGMTINSTVISIIKSRQRRRGISLKKEFITTVWTRIATSSAFGIIIDVSLFSLVAFYGMVPSEKLSSIIVFEDAYKISYEILLAPLSILLIYLLKVKEKVDIYDELSNLNPFRIDTNYKISANKFNENYIKPTGKNDG